jgi:S-adenosylmethionine hydrolase
VTSDPLIVTRPTIALLTDFGLDDYYVGTMKAVLADLCPEAIVIDITHNVPPQDVTTAAFALAAAVPYFPERTVFLVVVDPGVGTSRRGVAAQAGPHTFVGPDNGVFDLVFRRQPASLMVDLREPARARASVGRTFEGRDRFAPAAASLARGLSLDSLGPAVTFQSQLAWPVAHGSAAGVDGEIVHIDRFGNLMTNIERSDVELLLPAVNVAVGNHDQIRIVGTYGEGDVGELVALLNSADCLEVAVASGNAAWRLGVERGAQVRVRRRA